jgi:hypothetical protein
LQAVTCDWIANGVTYPVTYAVTYRDTDSVT